MALLFQRLTCEDITANAERISKRRSWALCQGVGLPTANPLFATTVAHTPISSWSFRIPRFLERDVWSIRLPRSFYIGVGDKFNDDKAEAAKWDDGSHPRDP